MLIINAETTQRSEKNQLISLVTLTLVLPANYQYQKLTRAIAIST